MRNSNVIRTVLVLVLLLPAAPAVAQLGNPVPQAVGMGGNYTAIARGFGAAYWNPAGLGMPDNPGMSLSILPAASTMGLDPISPVDFAEFDGEVIPHQTREEWLDLIRENGGEAGRFGADLSYIALSIGPVALQASSNVRSRANVSPDVAEVFLFGNAGLTGEPRDYTLDGSEFDVAGTTTVAASLAIPLPLSLGLLPDQHFAVGATLKYTMGNFLVLGRESGSTFSTDPVEANVVFPVIHTRFPDDSTGVSASEAFDNGRGIGLDVGAAWQGGIFSAGVSVRNLVNTFEWDLTDLQYREGEATWTADTAFTSFEEMPAEEAPAQLLERIGDLYEFPPILSAGAAARVLPFLTVTGEVRHAIKENLDVGERNHMGVGAELTILPFLPIRAGAAVISGGYQLTGGLGLRLGGAQLAASLGMRDSDTGTDTVGALGLTFGLP
ncbi:MAG TPA: conjugal transfer protein TraF [Longimicrobiales bacterium]|nr:conjugal transfer protein TraF [Longimicrobiales bacterium]